MPSSKVYTKTGDKGQTSLIGGTRVAKSHLRLEAYGTVDELNSHIGLAISFISPPAQPTPSQLSQLATRTEIQMQLQKIQNELFNIGSQLACENVEILSTLPKVSTKEVERLEQQMDQFSQNLIQLKNFILPGGSKSASQIHICRTVCRRAERISVAFHEDLSSQTNQEILKNSVQSVIIYLNRLSDYFFVLSRFLNHLEGVVEPLWIK